jgi:hypothetical protein
MTEDEENAFLIDTLLAMLVEVYLKNSMTLLEALALIYKQIINTYHPIEEADLLERIVKFYNKNKGKYE